MRDDHDDLDALRVHVDELTYQRDRLRAACILAADELDRLEVDASAAVRAAIREALDESHMSSSVTLGGLCTSCGRPLDG